MNTSRRIAHQSLAIVATTLIGGSSLTAATNYTVLGWNNLGMHCMDSDYSVFCILPPYNTVHAQVVMTVNGSQVRLVTNAMLAATYEGVADPDGSINTTSIGKTGFWDYAQRLFGVAAPVDVGLPVPGPTGWQMPGISNAPQTMAFETSQNWFAAYGIPITPYDDAGRPNQYPLLRIAVKNGSTTQAWTDIVAPVSDEMNCRLCHWSGSGNAARPAAGWVNEAEPGRDYRLNILRLHDERQLSNPDFRRALATLGLHSNGLFATVTQRQQPILCASCHLSEALPGSGIAGIAPLTRAVHGRHANVLDPRNGEALDSSANRSSCYTCHPGSATRCLRGAMGKAVAADGSMSMQCQNCHGGMSDVASPNRTGWLEEPNCQACHVGTATNRYGTIRFLSALTNGGGLRAASEQTFATTPDTPAPGISLYRFSRGHGGLQCAACHGSTHAEYPAAGRNDNLQNIRLQGHAGVIAECTLCHGTTPNTLNGGPHGMHATGNNFAQNHADLVENNGGAGQCKACHGATYRGTVLSRALGDRTLTTKFGTRRLWQGAQVSCYLCHNGPDTSNPSPNTPPVVARMATNTPSGVSVAMKLGAADANGNSLTMRIVSQPSHGTVALTGTNATYFPDAGFSGTDTFTFAASDGFADSNLGTGVVQVVLSDGDADGIPDWWVQQWFAHPLAGAGDLSRPGDDPDGDGVSNLREFLAGTDPLDARDAMALTSLRPQPGATELRIATALGQHFDIESSETLGNEALWSKAVTNLWGRQDALSVTVSNTTAARFFRITPPRNP